MSARETRYLHKSRLTAHCTVAHWSQKCIWARIRGSADLQRSWSLSRTILRGILPQIQTASCLDQSVDIQANVHYNQQQKQQNCPSLTTLRPWDHLYDGSQTGQSARYSQSDFIHPLLVHYSGIEGGIEMCEVWLRCQPQTHHTHHDTQNCESPCVNKLKRIHNRPAL